MGSVFRSDWVAPFLRRHRAVLAIAVILSVLSVLFASALMFTSGYMISLAATIPFTVLALHIPSIFVRIFGVGKPILQYAERLTSHDWVLCMTSSLRLRLYKAAEVVSAESAMGRMLGLFADDLEHLQNLFLRTMFPMLVISATYLIVVVAFGVLSPLMGVLMLASIGIAAFAMPFWALAAHGAHEERRRRIVSQMYDSLSEDVLGIVDWGLAGREEELLGKMSEGYERQYEETRMANASERRLAVLRQGLYCAIVVCVLAWASYAFFGIEGAVPDGLLATEAAKGIAGVTMHDSVPYAANWIAAFVLFMFPLLDSFTPASEAVRSVAEHKGALAQLEELDIEADAVGNAEASMATPCKDAAHAIEFDEAAFAYPGRDALVLDDVCLDVRKGEHVVILGRSGAGKSTMLSLAAGNVAPTKGSVRHSGKIGMVEQFPYVFRKSLRENLLLADPDATDEDILDALEKVGLTALVNRHPKGLDTLMAEGGATLSGGERHRLALARILLFDCDIVLLDEPYLGLDEATREAVSRTLLDALSEKTILLVTHDEAHGREYDRVMQVVDGTVVED